MVIKRNIKIAFLGCKGIPAKWGGIEKYIEEIGTRLADRGHDVTVFGSKWYCAQYRGALYRGIHLQRVSSIRFQATDALTNALNASLAIMKNVYDIVHFHGLASYYTIPMVKMTGKITVATAHAMESNWDNVKYNRLGRLVIKKAFETGMKHAHCVTTVAEHLKEKIKKDYSRNALLLPSGLDRVEPHKPDIIRKKYGLQGQDYLLFLGRIDPIKRPEWVLELAQVLDKRIKLVIAGGPQDAMTEIYLNDLKNKAAAFTNIIFTGSVIGNEKAELFSNCRLFLAPSLDEGLPLTVMEAIAYGKCCVVSDIPAFRSIIENDVSGFIVSKTSIENFVFTVSNLMQSQQRLTLIGKEAKRRIISKFDWNGTTEKTEQLYFKLLDNKINFNNPKVL
jgi:glycosyltransferase involved in cell wall biosynthesis